MEKINELTMTVIDSDILANNLKLVNTACNIIDVDYLELSAKAFFEQANMQDTLAVLNPNYNNLKL